MVLCQFSAQAFAEFSVTDLLWLRMSGYQFSPFEIGQIKAHLHHGLGATQIARITLKPDGRSHWSDTAVQKQIDKLGANPRWKGVRQEGSGDDGGLGQTRCIKQVTCQCASSSVPE